MGERFSAKDFRTWAGTLIAACALARLKTGEVEGRTDRRKTIVAAVKETAAQLGNTPAVCKTSYIWPSVLDSFLRGHVVTNSSEKALLRLLRSARLAGSASLH